MHSNVIEAPPAGAAPWTKEVTRDERSAQIEKCMKGLEFRYNREGERLGPKKTLVNLEHIVKRDPHFRWRLRYNGLSESVEWEGRRLRDEDVTRIRLMVAHTYEVQFSADDVHAIINEAARAMTVHPVHRFLMGLLWDKQPRIDAFLSTYAGVEDTPLTRAISRRWFVSCVARAMGRGLAPVKVDTVLILAGPQGARKSTLFRALAGDEWFSDTALDLRNKDAYQAIRGVWIYELAELAATRPRDAETVKAFLSAPTDRYRPPYGRNMVESHRQCVFVGTTNEASFLADPTGARRFWPVTVGEIDIEAVKRDRLMLWAEAVEAWQAGETWWLTRDEDAELREAQEQYQHEDPWEVALDEWLASAENAAQARGGMRVGELLTQALKMDRDRMGKQHEMRFGGMLQRRGWQKRRDRRGGKRVTLWVPLST